ncbi:hypothetical protein [Neomoorella thermoacetica]|nr:hypothetical protein [Moorella thermoacetica]
MEPVIQLQNMETEQVIQLLLKQKTKKDIIRLLRKIKEMGENCVKESFAANID